MEQKSNIIIYTTEDGLTKIETTFDEDTVWLSIDQMAELFQRNKSTISRHIKNIFSEGELVRESVVANFATTAADGKKEFMGLTTFVGNQPTLKEAVVAKNYLSEKELRAMGQLVSGYLDFAERQAEREQVMTICINFKDFVEPGKIETEPLLAEMPAYAKRYQILLGGNSGSAALDACIDRLNRLETMVIRPYFLEVLRLYNENKLTLAQVTEIFLTTENYLFRRTMCDLPTNRSNFTGRIAPARSRKSPEIKPFHGHWSTFAGKAHGIKDRVLLDDTCGSGGFFVRTKKQRGDME